MALTRSDPVGFRLCRLTFVDLGRPEDCFVPKQLGWGWCHGLVRLSACADGLWVSALVRWCSSALSRS